MSQSQAWHQNEAGELGSPAALSSLCAGRPAPAPAPAPEHTSSFRTAGWRNNRLNVATFRVAFCTHAVAARTWQSEYKCLRCLMEKCRRQSGQNLTGISAVPQTAAASRPSGRYVRTRRDALLFCRVRTVQSAARDFAIVGLTSTFSVNTKGL